MNSRPRLKVVQVYELERRERPRANFTWQLVRQRDWKKIFKVAVLMFLVICTSPLWLSFVIGLKYLYFGNPAARMFPTAIFRGHGGYSSRPVEIREGQVITQEDLIKTLEGVGFAKWKGKLSSFTNQFEEPCHRCYAIDEQGQRVIVRPLNRVTADGSPTLPFVVNFPTASAAGIHLTNLEDRPYPKSDANKVSANKVELPGRQIGILTPGGKLIKTVLVTSTELSEQQLEPTRDAILTLEDADALDSSFTGKATARAALTKARLIDRQAHGGSSVGNQLWGLWRHGKHPAADPEVLEQKEKGFISSFFQQIEANGGAYSLYHGATLSDGFPTDEYGVLAAYVNSVPCAYMGYSLGACAEKAFGQDIRTLRPEQQIALVASIKNPFGTTTLDGKVKWLERINYAISQMKIRWPEKYSGLKEVKWTDELDLKSLTAPAPDIWRNIITRHTKQDAAHNAIVTSRDQALHQQNEVVIREGYENYVRSRRLKLDNIDALSLMAITLDLRTLEVLDLSQAGRSEVVDPEAIQVEVASVGKLFITYAWLRAGHSADERLPNSERDWISFLARKGFTKIPYRPKNYPDDIQTGTVNLWQAIAKSYDTPFAYIMHILDLEGQQLGVSRELYDARGFIRAWGGKLPADISVRNLTYGSYQMSLVNIARFVSTIARNGNSSKRLNFVKAIEDSRGLAHGQVGAVFEQLLDQDVCQKLNLLLTMPVKAGTITGAMRFAPTLKSMQVHGKTGSSNRTLITVLYSLDEDGGRLVVAAFQDLNWGDVKEIQGQAANATAPVAVRLLANAVAKVEIRRTETHNHLRERMH